MINIKPKILIAAAVVLLIIMALVWINGQPQLAPPTHISAPQHPPVGALPPLQKNPSNNKVSPPPAKPVIPQNDSVHPKITFLYPAAGDKFTAGRINTIKWNSAGGVKGSLFLVQASDNSVVGWINSETGINQTSFDWDARDVFISRYSPLKKNIERGTYRIHVKFDGPGTPEYVSDSFSVLYPGEIPVSVYPIEIKNYLFSPSSLTVKQSDQVVFTNNDPVAETITLTAHSPVTIDAGAIYNFDTSSLFSGNYNFYSETRPTLLFKLTVQ